MDLDFSFEGLHKQKALIGDFIIQFEHLIDWMRFTIPNILYDIPPSNLEIRNAETLLAELGAEQIRAKFDSLLIDNFSEQTKLIESNNKLSTKFAEMTRIRNTVAHGTYRLGWKNFEAEMNDENFSIRHSKATKKGYEKRSLIISVEDFELLTNSTRTMYGCYRLICSAITSIKHNKRAELTERHLNNLEIEVNKIGNTKLNHLDILN